MAKIFSDENGNIGTIIVLKGRPQDYLSETHTYHGEHEILDTHIVEALKFDNGALIEDMDKLKDIKKREVEARHKELRAEIKIELDDAILDGGDVVPIKAKAARLKINKDEIIKNIDRKLKADTVKSVDHLSFTHEV